MKHLYLFILTTFAAWSATPAISPDHVAVIYNSTNAESKALAEAYALARSIPADQLLGLKLSEAEEITREEYVKSLETPLREIFTEKKWWQLGRMADGVKAAGECRIKVLVTMRGVPLKIARLAPKSPAPAAPANPAAVANEASVDSELAMLSIHDLPKDGPSKNPFFENTDGIAKARMPFIMLVGRIDGPDAATCQRMIRDAVETEKTGLWGRGYYDLAQFYPDGEKWIRTAAFQAMDQGIPAELNPWKETFPKHYPLTDAALYFGWYEWNVCGPFVRPGFSFRKGAIAVHLHSFSASTVRNAGANWCGPLLSRGAAATLGNVYEPYLHMTHHFDAFQQSLLNGSTLVEAAYSSIPVLSWQAVVLGDPLYRPFLHLDGTGEKADADRPYRALRVAKKIHQSSDTAYLAEIERVGRKKSNATFLETLGHIHLSRKNTPAAVKHFREAKAFYKEPADRLRCDLHIIGIDRDAGRKDIAIKGLRDAEILYADLPEIETIRTLLTIIDPPPPPPVQPGTAPQELPKK